MYVKWMDYSVGVSVGDWPQTSCILVHNHHQLVDNHNQFVDNHNQSVDNHNQSVRLVHRWGCLVIIHN